MKSVVEKINYKLFCLRNLKHRLGYFITLKSFTESSLCHVITSNKGWEFDDIDHWKSRALCRVSMRIFIIMNEFHTKFVKPFIIAYVGFNFSWLSKKYSSGYTVLFAELTMSVTISNKHSATSFTYTSQWDPRYLHIKLITSRDF